MARLRLYHDRAGNSQSVWLDDPKKEHTCEEMDDDIVLVKDKRGRVIGFERLSFLTSKQQAEGITVPVEVQMV